MLTQDGQAAESERLLHRLLEREPNNDMAWGYLGFAELKLGHYAESASASQMAAEKSTLKVNYLACAGYAQSRMGDMRLAKRTLTEILRRREHHQWTPAEAVVLVYLALGDRNSAFRWMERAQSTTP